MAACSLETLQAIRLKVVEASPDAKIVINRLREVIDCNEEAEFLFGYARGDMLGKPIENLMPDELNENTIQSTCRISSSRPVAERWASPA